MKKYQVVRSIFKIILFTTSVLIVFSLGKFYQKGKQPLIKEVKTTVVGHKKMDVGILATGIIESKEMIKVRAEIDGIVSKIIKHPETEIKRGQLWGIIDSPQILQNLQNIEKIKVKLQELNIDYKNALITYNRLKELYSQGAVSKEMVERAEVEYNKISISIKLLEEELRVEENRREQIQRQTKVTSPISGAIVKQNVEEKMAVTVGTVLFTVANLNQLLVKINIPEADIVKIKRDMVAKITSDTLPGKEFQGRIFKIVQFPSESSNNIPLYEVLIEIKDPTHKLQIYRNVNVEIFSTQSERSLVVPIEAVTIREEKKVVFIVEDGIVRARKVTTGTIDVNNEYIEITSGLKEGEEICISDNEELVEGMKVKSIKQ